MKKRHGFTLAEVLITLGIIGVVAAMTIPTLMNATGSAEFKSGFKKAISATNQAITLNMALADTDFTTLASGTFGLDGSIANMFVTRMNVVSTAASAQTGTGLIDNAVSAATSAIVSNGTSNNVVFLNDGMAIGFSAAALNCTEAAPCKAIIDVNGAKKPNRLTTCGAVTAGVEPPAATCDKTKLIVGDRFSVRFYGNQVTPNGNAARWIMYN